MIEENNTEQSTEVSTEINTGVPQEVPNGETNPESAPKSGMNPSKIVLVFIAILLVGFIAATFISNFISEKKNKKYEFVPKETNTTNETEINFDVTYDNCLYTFKRVFTNGDYIVFQNPDYDKVKEEDVNEDYTERWNKYYILNTKKKILYNTFTVSGDKNNYNYYFVEYGPDGESTDSPRGMFNLNTEEVVFGYDDYSCKFHSDETTTICEKTDTTIVSNINEENETTLYGLISLKNYSVVLKAEYDYVNEDENGNFLVAKNKKHGLYSFTGTQLLKMDYDYIGLNSNIGYIAIKGKNVEYYDKDLNKLTFTKDTIKETYNNAIAKNNESKLKMTMAESYFWTAGSSMKIQDMSKPIDEIEEGKFRYKSKNKKIKGEQLIINSECMGSNNEFIYVIDGAKATKITNKELVFPEKSSEDEADAFCF